MHLRRRGRSESASKGTPPATKACESCSKARLSAKKGPRVPLEGAPSNETGLRVLLGGAPFSETGLRVLLADAPSSAEAAPLTSEGMASSGAAREKAREHAPSRRDPRCTRAVVSPSSRPGRRESVEDRPPSVTLSPVTSMFAPAPLVRPPFPHVPAGESANSPSRSLPLLADERTGCAEALPQKGDVGSACPLGVVAA